MVRRAWLFALVLLVPTIGWSVSEGIQASLNSEFRAEVRKQFPEANTERLASFTIDDLCRVADPDFAATCTTNWQLNLLSTVSLVAAGVGLSLIGMIALAGIAARRDRMLLLRLFRPGLRITANVVVGLICVHAAIGIATIYFGESALTNRVHVGVILAIALGALAGVAAVGRGVDSLVQKAQTIAIGKPVSREDAPRLWEAIEQTASRMGALQPEHVVVGLDPNFFVTEADVLTLNGKLTGRTLYCSLSLARILTTDEFRAVIGHELGHFRGLDTKFSERFYPIYRGTATSIASLQTAGGEGWGVVALLPAIAVLSYFLEAFAVAESRLGRERELEADKAGASVTSSEVMAAALVKVHAYCGVWEGLQEAVEDALKKGRMFANLASTYAETVIQIATPSALENLSGKHLSHPTDSHPPLSVRLDSLSMSMPSLTNAALTVAPTDAAIALIHNSEKWELDISETYQLLVAKHMGAVLGGEGHEETQAQSPVQRCGNCHTRVLPTTDGRCPSCGSIMGADPFAFERPDEEPVGPPLSEAETIETRRAYARLPSQRLEELLQERHDLRPGAEELLREELERRRPVSSGAKSALT
jgi:Zn-dependent protease with chaperone function